MDNDTISGRCYVVKGQAQVPATVTSSSVKDALERFMLWAGNTGALRSPASKLSLDSRLAGSRDLRDYISTELENLSEAIEDRIIKISNGSSPDRQIAYMDDPCSESDLDMDSDDSSCSDDPVHEAGSILQVISQSITSLLKSSSMTLQPASSNLDRFHRAAGDSEKHVHISIPLPESQEHEDVAMSSALEEHEGIEKPAQSTLAHHRAPWGTCFSDSAGDHESDMNSEVFSTKSRTATTRLSSLYSSRASAGPHGSISQSAHEIDTQRVEKKKMVIINHHVSNPAKDEPRSSDYFRR
ncbi:hypothetical protein QBC32DRAFT_326600 [Pseudoneurospora amorphoporcata]|uniref:Uncharacterized protein n=1 Tax=Pseudoneurospora amorphoporcata TaxID=241081 RepID=A0AAN6NQB9_9PEZI|nr:hypothetical protein QBC32DRAFT_326600 [Pseudoneurospora amorphoporcata]